MLVVIAAVYALFTLPYHVTWLFSVFGYPNSVAKKLCVLLVIATSAAHPIIYGTLNQEFGKGFKAVFRCLKQRDDYEIPLDTRKQTNMTQHGLNGKYKVNHHVKWRVIYGGKQLAIASDKETVNEMVSCL